MESLEFQLLLYKLLTSAIDRKDNDGETKEKLSIGGEVLTTTQFLGFMKRLTKSMLNSDCFSSSFTASNKQMNKLAKGM
jgi:hypothetical protein